MAGVVPESIVDGPGIRYAVFVQGCPHGCPGCHNPITWDPNGGLLFDAAAKQELFQELEKDFISGITLSGGDPLYFANRADILRLVREIKGKFPQKTVWLYTGFVWEAVEGLEIMKYVDVLVDGEFQIAQKDTQLHWRGSANQRLIYNPGRSASGVSPYPPPAGA